MFNLHDFFMFHGAIITPFGQSRTNLMNDWLRLEMEVRTRMYKRILIPLDGSELAEQVLPYARALAKALSARLDLFEVIEPPPSRWADSAHGVSSHLLADSLKNPPGITWQA